jgi:hypothetical protein
MSKSAAQYAARRLKMLAQRQVRAIEPRRRQMPIRPSEQRRRYQSGEEAWRLQAGLITPEQYQRYLDAMSQEEF